MKSLILIAVCFSISFSSISTSFAQGRNFSLLDFYDNQNGMSQGTINAIVQDKHGYIWFGTQDGLNKFDGLEFTIYKNDRSNPKSISDNYINAIITDDNGDLWIATNNGGLNRYDIETGIFEVFKHQEENAHSISSNKITAIAQALDGKIWIGTTEGGLNRLDPTTGELDVYITSSEDVTSISSNNITSLFIDNDNELWVGTDHGLNRLASHADDFIRYYNDTNVKSSLSNDHILAIWQDENQQVWIGTSGGGLNRLDKKTQLFKSYQTNDDDPTSLNNDIINTIIGGEDGNIWIGTDGGYLNLFTPSLEMFSTYQVTFPRVRALYKDNVGDIWVGTRGGVNKISKYSNMFSQYSLDNFGNLISPNGDLHALSKDEEGYIWAGSSVDGLKRINPKTLEVKSYVASADENSLSNTNVRYIFIDKEKRMWIGTANGLNLYDKEADTFTTFLPDENNNTSISSGRISQIFEDSRNNLWICTDGGLNMLDRKTGKFLVMKSQPDVRSLYSDNISTIFEDENGIYWVGFNSEGFDRYDPETGEFKHFEHKDEDVNSLSNDRVFHLYDDSNGYLWIATYGGGLNKFEKATEKFTHYSEKNGLANASLYCVLEDEKGNLWMSHNEGISRFNPAEETFKNYFDGVEFNSRAFYQTITGEILLGSFDIVSFFPENIIDNDLIPTVRINEFELFHKVVTPADGLQLLKKVTEETDTIILKYNENFFSFGFVSLSYTNAENNRFKYKLENFDDDWNDAWDYPHAKYTNVSPGEYVFRVIGSNNDHVWNEEGDGIYVKVLAPWWGTLFFRVTVVVITIIILLSLYKIRLRSIKKQKADLEKLVDIRTHELRSHEAEIIEQNEQLVELNEEKNELINIVSHDLRSPLNQIKGLASIIKMINPKLNEETSNSIDLINDLVDRQRNMIAKILDTNAIDTNKTTLNISKTNINSLIEEVVSTMQAVAANKNISLKIQLAGTNTHIEADKSYLIQAIENILSNAIKFSNPDTKIIISTNSTEGKIQIGIKDEGPGITTKDMKHLFESYRRLSAQPTGDEDSTGLGLSIAKKYVENMNGKIWCESEVGNGAKFILEFDLI